MSESPYVELGSYSRLDCVVSCRVVTEDLDGDRLLNIAEQPLQDVQVEYVDLLHENVRVFRSIDLDLYLCEFPED